MLISEVHRILVNRKSKFFIFLIFIIPCIDLLSNCYTYFYDFLIHPEAYGGEVPKENILHPSKASFLSGTSQGHVAQMLLIWVLPLYLLIIYSDFHIQEKKIGYSNILLTKLSRKQFLSTRFFLSFFLPFIIILISLVINFALSIIVFHGGQSFQGMESFSDTNQSLLTVSLNNPYLVYIVYILIFSLIAGGCGIICTSLSFLFTKYKYVYSIAFFIWIIQIILPNSLTYLMQPFIEYGFDKIIPASSFFIFIVIVLFLSAWFYKVKFDEI